MKVFYLFLITISTSYSSVFARNNTDLKEMSVLGKVKSIFEYTIPIRTNSSNNIKVENIEKSIIFFNEFGFISFEKNTNGKNIGVLQSKFSYDYKNNLINYKINILKKEKGIKKTVSKYHYSTGKVVVNTTFKNKLINREIIQYLKNNVRAVKMYDYDANGKIVRLVYHKRFYYNNEKQLLKTELYLPKYNTNDEYLDWKEEFFYTSKSHRFPNRKNVYLYDNLPNNCKLYQYSFKYKFDEKGNWIERSIIDNYVEVKIKRQINYF
jgi:hypothetical protein